MFCFVFVLFVFFISFQGEGRAGGLGLGETHFLDNGRRAAAVRLLHLSLAGELLSTQSRAAKEREAGVGTSWQHLRASEE